MNRFRMRCLPVLLGMAAGVYGQSLDEEESALRLMVRLMETPIEISSVRATPILSTPSSVTIVDRKTLEGYGVQTLAEAVELVAGMSKMRTTFFRDVLTSRGVLQEHYANRVLLLIEGVSVWEAVSGAAAPGRIDIHDVERIEVLKGPASVLYGSNAYSGAINIILRSSFSQETVAHAGVLDQGGHQAGVRLARQWGEGSAFVSANLHREEGAHLDIPGEGGIPIPTSEFLDNRSANLKFEFRGHTFLVNTYESKFPHLGISVRPATGGGQDFINQGTLLGYGLSLPLPHHGEFRIGVAWDAYDRDYDTSADASDARRAKGYRLSQTLSALWDLSPSFTFEVGGSHELRHSDHFQTYNPTTGQVKDENHLKNIEVKESSGHVQGQFTQGKWALLLGSRYTRNENFGSNVSSRATLVRRLDQRSSLKLIWGQSYRAPTLLEQYTLVPGFLYGNPEARPETSDSVELAYLLQRGGFFIQALAHASTYKNKLIRVPTYPKHSSDPNDTSLTYDNGPEFRAKGLELEIRYEGPKRFGAFLNMDYLHGDKGDQLPGVRGTNFGFAPVYSAKLGLTRKLEAWRFSTVLHHEGPAQGPLAPIRSRTALDLFLGYRHAWGRAEVSHGFSLRNAGATEHHYPEYVRRNINEIPDGLGRRAGYVVEVWF